MNLSNISHLFQMNVQPMQRKQAFKQPESASADVLQQISDQIISEEKSKPHVSIRQELMDKFTKRSLEDMPEEGLEAQLQLIKLFSNLSRGHEKALVDFKDRIQEMDQTIQGYQDILDGKSAPPKGISIDSESAGKVVARLLAKVTQEREQFIQKGVEDLNRWGGGIVRDGHSAFSFQLKLVLGEDKFEGKDSSTWMIDPAADLFSEIDRVLEETHKVTGELNRGIQTIYNVLEKRDLGDKYKGYLDFSPWNQPYFGPSEEQKLQMTIDGLTHSPLHEVESKKNHDLPGRAI